MRFGVAWGKFMKENGIDSLMHLRKLNRDKTYSIHSYSRPLQVTVNAVTALKAPWNQLMGNQEAE